jgi:hypothetical protein
MRIVEAGARHDLGQLDAALLTLQDFGLDRTSTQPWSARVWYAYADLLLAADREDEAREWFRAAADADRDGSTDADERLLQLDGIEVLEDEDADDSELTDVVADEDADELADELADDSGLADVTANEDAADALAGEVRQRELADDSGFADVTASEDAADALAGEVRQRELADDTEGLLPHDGQLAGDSEDAEPADPDPEEGDGDAADSSAGAAGAAGAADAGSADEPIGPEPADVGAAELSDGLADAGEVEIVPAPAEPGVLEETEAEDLGADAVEDAAAEAVLAEVVDNPVEPVVEDEPVADGPAQPSSPIVLTFSDQAESGSSE